MLRQNPSCPTAKPEFVLYWEIHFVSPGFLPGMVVMLVLQVNINFVHKTEIYTNQVSFSLLEMRLLLFNLLNKSL